jgi:hypothetical protein
MTRLRSPGTAGIHPASTSLPYVARTAAHSHWPPRTYRPAVPFPLQTSQDNKIWVWEVATQKVIGRLDGHKALVVCVECPARCGPPLHLSQC